MNALGKLLSVFVFLGALVWLGFTVILFATRADWKATALKAQDDAKQAHEKADQRIKEAVDDRERYEKRHVADTQAVAALKLERNNFETEYNKLKDATAALQSATQKLQPQLDEYQTVNNTLQNQANSYSTQVALLTTARDKAVLSQEAAERARNDATLALGVNQKALEDQIEKTRSLLESTRGGVAEADAAFRGDVLQVGNSKGESLDIVTFSGGANAGVTKGKQYIVTRPVAPYYVGTLTVLDASHPQYSFGLFTPAAGQKLAGDYVPKKGDTVASK